MFHDPTTKTSGISCIPPEILGEIFIRCLPIDFASQSQNIQQLLSSVCKLWRAVALATPAFWASLIITYGTDVLHPPLPVIHAHLQRSGSHPLLFVLQAAKPVSIFDDDTRLLTALTTLAAARQRWDSVDIRLPTARRGLLDFLTQGDAPLLRSIHCDMSGSIQLPIPLCMLDRCPRLESFRWSGPGSPILLPVIATSLTSLSLRATLSVSEGVTILRLSPRLSSAAFGVRSSPGPSTTAHVTHPTLCTLKIRGIHSDMLLTALTLPALLDLDVTTEEDMQTSEWSTTLPAFLERSRPTLHRLVLSVTQMPVETTFVRILTLTPHLRSLALDGPLGSAPVTALARGLYPQSQPGTPLCPRLQILHLSEISGCPDGLCTTMLRGRWGACAHENEVASLWDMHIKLLGIHDRDRAEIRELRAEGMSATMFWGDGWTLISSD